MHFPSHEQKQALLEKVLRIADQRLKGAEAKEARAFISHYYDQVDVLTQLGLMPTPVATTA